MKISCPSCKAAFALDDKRVPPAGLTIRCPKCKNPFSVKQPQPGDEGRIVEGTPVVRGPSRKPEASPPPEPAPPQSAPEPPLPPPEPEREGAIPLPGAGPQAAPAQAPFEREANPSGASSEDPFGPPGRGATLPPDDPFAIPTFGAPPPQADPFADPSLGATLGPDDQFASRAQRDALFQAAQSWQEADGSPQGGDADPDGSGPVPLPGGIPSAAAAAPQQDSFDLGFPEPGQELGDGAIPLPGGGPSAPPPAGEGPDLDFGPPASAPDDEFGFGAIPLPGGLPSAQQQEPEEFGLAPPPDPAFDLDFGALPLPGGGASAPPLAQPEDPFSFDPPPPPSDDSAELSGGPPPEPARSPIGLAEPDPFDDLLAGSGGPAPAQPPHDPFLDEPADSPPAYAAPSHDFTPPPDPPAFDELSGDEPREVPPPTPAGTGQQSPSSIDDLFDGIDVAGDGNGRAPQPPAPASDPFDIDHPLPAAPPASGLGDDPFGIDLPPVAPSSPRAPPAAAAPAPAVRSPIDDGAFTFELADDQAVVPKEIAAEPRPRAGGAFVDAPSAPAKAGGRSARPPPIVSRQDSKGSDTVDPFDPDGDDAAGGPGKDGKAGKPAKKKKAPKPTGAPMGERLQRLRERIQVLGEVLRARPRAVAGMGVALLVAGFVATGLRAGSTDAGYFWKNRFASTGRPNPKGAAAAIKAGTERLGEGTYAGARGAIAIAAEALKTMPDDEDLKALYVLCTSEMMLLYNPGGSDVDQARRLAERLKPTDPARAVAMAAYALASNDAPRARTLLSPVADAPGASREAIFLYALALNKVKEVALAAQVLDNGIKTQPAAKLYVLRGQLARQKGQLPEAASWFEQALAQRPQHGLALIELADTKLRQKEVAGAEAALTRLLDPEVHKQLDVREDARAALLRAGLLAAQHKGKEALEQFDRAQKLDAGSKALSSTFGLFRLRRREYEKATELLKVAVSNEPSNAGLQAALVRSCLGQSNLVLADKQVREALQAAPENLELLFLQGKVAEAIGKSEEAAQLYEKLIAKKADHGETLIAQGMAALAKGNRDAARAKLEAALQAPLEPRSVLELEALGELAAQLGEAARSREIFSAALAADPEDPLAHAGLGRALSELGELKAAKAELEIAVAAAPTDAATQFEYGSILRKTGELAEARAALAKSVQLDSKEGHGRYLARLGAILVELKEYAEAEKTLRQAIVADDRISEGFLFLGRCLAEQKEKRLPEAIEMLKRGLDLDPTNSAAFQQLGLVYEQGEQVSNAIDAFSKAVERNKKNVDALEHLGKNLALQNRFAEATDAFKRGLALDPERSRLLAFVGDAQQQAGDTEAALVNFQRSLKQDPEQSWVWTKLGIAYREKGCATCKDKAQEALLRAVKNDPKDALAWYHLGYLYKDDRRKAEAVAAFKKYVELAPNAPDVPTVKDDIFYLQEERKRAP